MSASNIAINQLLVTSPEELLTYITPETKLDGEWLIKYVAYHQQQAKESLAEDFAIALEDTLKLTYEAVASVSPRSKAGKRFKVRAYKLDVTPLPEFLEERGHGAMAKLLIKYGVT